MATLYANGLIPQSALDPVPAIGGSAWLLPIPARAYLDVVAECERRHGWSPVITSAGDGFRSYQRQVNVFLERYEPRSSGGRDVRWWKGVRYVRVRGAAAAVPGTSNHGKGITVDVSGLGAFTSLRYGQFRAIAERHGWSNAEGRSVGEPWHWNYTRTAYPVDNTNTLPGVSINAPGGVLPGDLTPKDGFDMAEVNEVVDKLVLALTPVIKAQALSAAVEAIDARRNRDRKDMLDQANQAVAPVLDVLEVLPDDILNTRIPGIVEGSASTVANLIRDARVAATTGRNAALEAADNTRPAPAPAPAPPAAAGAAPDTTPEA